MNNKTLLITGTSGFLGYNFLKYILSKNYHVIDILRTKKNYIQNVKVINKVVSSKKKKKIKFFESNQT